MSRYLKWCSMQGRKCNQGEDRGSVLMKVVNTEVIFRYARPGSTLGSTPEICEVVLSLARRHSTTIPV